MGFIITIVSIDFLLSREDCVFKNVYKDLKPGSSDCGDSLLEIGDEEIVRFLRIVLLNSRVIEIYVSSDVKLQRKDTNTLAKQFHQF